jgi:hypothetical protein
MEHQTRYVITALNPLTKEVSTVSVEATDAFEAFQLAKQLCTSHLITHITYE